MTRVSHRRYTEGFIDGVKGQLQDLQYCDSSAYLRNYRFSALVLEVVRHDLTNQGCLVRLNVKDRLRMGSKVEVIAPGMDDYTITIISLQKESGEMVAEVHPGTVALARCQGLLAPYHILRQPVADTGVAV